MNFQIQREMPRAQRAWLSIFLFLAAGALAFAPQKTHAQTGASREYQIKAAFLFHFAQFVEWPSVDFTNANAPFVIGVLGDNPFGNALDEIVKGESISNRKITVQYSRSAEDLKNCQIVFVSKSEKTRLSRILAELNRKNILTVGECDGFTQLGGVMNFYLENDTVHFEINPDAAAREKLKISSLLFRLGKIVTTRPKN
ncbi:MAG TPA: YfiR family protein [Candidatus Aquilonibacter sp.]|nr:YfiR family protein [Candidatus Aquilonibacter sp.]